MHTHGMRKMDESAVERLRSWMDANSQTKSELARAIGLSPSQASRIVRGEFHPSFRTAREIERVTGVPTTAWPKFAPVDEAAQ